MATRLSSLFRQFKQSWSLLAAFTTWLLAIIGGFLLPPPIGADQYEFSDVLSKLGLVVTIVLVGLLSVPLMKWKSKVYTLHWSVAGLASMFFAVVAFFSYLYLINNWTCLYNDNRLVIGSEFTAHGKAYVESNPHRVSPRDWVMAHGGNVSEIWTDRSINRRCAILGLLYVATLPLFAVAMIGTLHAIYCYSPQPLKRAQGSSHRPRLSSAK